MDAEFRRIGRYKIAKLVVEGAQGRIYKAYDSAVEQFVAIKIMRKDLLFSRRGDHEVARFRADIQCAGRLFHPNIVAVLGTGEERGYAYVTLEWIEGRILAGLLRKGEGFTIAATLNMAGQILAALEYAHGRNILHRGLNPASVVLIDSSGIKVKDFAGGKAEGGGALLERLPIDRLAYLAPEHFATETTDPRADLFSAGCILYQLLAGRPPFRGETLSALWQDIRGAILPPPSELNPAAPAVLDAVVLKALAKLPGDRFRSAAEFAAAIREAVAGAASPVLRPQPEPVADRKVFHRRSVASGEAVFHEGDPGDAAYIIESGIVQISKTGEGGLRVPLATVGRGEIIGEMALVDNQPRMASAYALDDCVLVMIPRDEFQARLARVDKVTHKLIGVLVNRVRSLAEEVTTLNRMIG